MPLSKVSFRPGVNRENTRYTTEGGWYDCDKVRFRQGTPEKIGGWSRISVNTFLGICRSLWNWITLASNNLMGVGTNSKFYIERGGVYYDVTPVRSTAALTSPFTATNGSAVLLVTHASHGATTGDFVTFSGAALTGLGGNITASVLTGEFEITALTTNTYTITVSVAANATDASGSPGGGTVTAQYQVNAGEAEAVPTLGWGSGGWGVSSWGGSATTTATSDTALRVWNQMNFGEDLVFGPNGGGIYYWDATSGTAASTVTITIASPAVATFSFEPTEGMPVMFTTTGALPTGLSVGTVYYAKNAGGLTANLSATYNGATITTTGTQSGVHSVSPRGINISQLPGADNVPTVHTLLLVSEVSRFVFAFGCNDIGETELDPLLVRWSDQESAAIWYPQATNQAGSQRLSSGSRIVAALQTRQEILTWTDASLYSLQYVGPPIVWSVQPLGYNLSIISSRAASVASGVTYWMGTDKFYKYDGRAQTLRCDLRQYVYNDLNINQTEQIFSGTNEGFNEVWWFYCSSGSSTVDRYVVYNYAEDVWYYGTMARTAWLDTSLRNNPHAATYSQNLVAHESGINDSETGAAAPIEAYITSSEFDISDGHNFGFVWRIVPDITFNGSTASAPSATLTLHVLRNAGAGYTSPGSVGGSNSAVVTRTVDVPVEQFTGQVYTRVRGRQMALTVSSNQLNTTWQLGAPRIDVRPDGRR